MSDDPREVLKAAGVDCRALDDETVRRIAWALSHNCSNAFCTIRDDDYPDLIIPGGGR